MDCLFTQFDQGIFALDRLVIALQRRRGRCQQHQRSFGGATVAGDVVGAVFGVHVGFIGMLLLLVDDNSAEVFDGRKHGGAGADHDGGQALADALVGVVALAGRQSRVNDRHALAEAGAEDGDGLGCQGNLGK